MQFFSVVLTGLVKFFEDNGQILVYIIFVLNLVFEASNWYCAQIHVQN